MAGIFGTVPVPQAVERKGKVIATDGQTSFATAGYTVGYVDVWLDGLQLEDVADYAATNGSDIVLVLGTNLNQVFKWAARVPVETINQVFTGSTQIAALGDVTPGSAVVTSLNGGQLGGNRNLIINGAMTVDQRAKGVAVTGITTSAYHTVDRWQLVLSGAGTWTMAQVASSIAGHGKALRFTCTTANASLGAGDHMFFRTKLEGQDLQHILKGTANAKNLSLSFPVLCDDTKTFVVELYDFDNTRHVCGTMTISSGGTEQDVSFDFPADVTGAFGDDANASLGMNIWLAAGSDYTSGTLATSWASVSTANRAVGCSNLADAVSNYFEITGIQLEVGSTATPFEHESYGVTKAKCQRYYYQTSELKLWATPRFSLSTGTGYGAWYFPVAMRAAPTFTESGTWSSTTGYGGDPLLNVAQVDYASIKTTNTIAANGNLYLHGGNLHFDAEL
jgi:hypothetical protein